MTPANPHPPVPPRSRRSQPRFSSEARRAELAGAFAAAGEGAGEDYDRLRPGYPDEALDAMLAAVPGAREAVDLGAGTGKLSRALAGRGLAVTAVDPAASMLAVLRSTGEVPGEGSVLAQRGTAERTGLGEGSADLVTAAQAWHWFDTEAASREARRLLRPGGMLALLWNTMDVTVPWVHRLSRIMHAGDVQRDDFTPPLGAGLTVHERHVVRWEDPLPTGDLIDLARTRSYVITASAQTRGKVLGNLDWYLHEHLGHAPGDVVGLPYRTDLFLCAAA